MISGETARTALALSSVIPWAIVCFLPAQGHLRGRGREIALWGIPALAVWALLGGLLCGGQGWKLTIWLAISLPAFGFGLQKLVDLPAWKSVSVFLAVCGVQSGVLNLATLAGVLMAGSSTPGVTLAEAAVLCLLSWAALGAAWYPATHAARWLLDEIEMPTTWYVFWILPVVFVGFNLFIRPVDDKNLFVGRMPVVYPVLILVLIALLCLFYFMFYLMAREMGANMRLLRENQFLQIQDAQYEKLQRSIEETRRARHDLRQHLMVLQDCIENRDWEVLSRYANAYGESIPPETLRSYSKNRAADAVLRYYAERAAQQQIEIEIFVQMEERTAIPEPEFCVLLGNLLENAVESCLRQERERFIRVNVRQQGEGLLSVTVDNACRQEPVVEQGRLRSVKHRGVGLGTESARRIAERYHGDLRFQWEDGVFYTSVMLNLDGESQTIAK